MLANCWIFYQECAPGWTSSKPIFSTEHLETTPNSCIHSKIWYAFNKTHATVTPVIFCLKIRHENVSSKNYNSTRDAPEFRSNPRKSNSILVLSITFHVFFSDFHPQSCKIFPLPKSFFNFHERVCDFPENRHETAAPSESAVQEHSGWVNPLW
jgi:hypothetical protein